MKAVNPRDVAYVFQNYARSIHQKVNNADPNMLKLSIACAKVSPACRSLSRSIHSYFFVPLPNVSSRDTLVDAHSLAQIDQWTEHHYPTFLQITDSGGQAATMIDASNGDARAPFFNKLINQAKDRQAAEKREAMMADLRARGIIKDRTPEEKAAAEKARAEALEESPPWLMIGAVIFGVLALMGLMGWGLVWFITTYLDD